MSKVLILLFFIAISFTGCSTKTVTEYVYKDVYIPVKCNAQIPDKPLNDRSFDSHKQRMIYFLKVEALLKECVGVDNESK